MFQNPFTCNESALDFNRYSSAMLRSTCHRQSRSLFAGTRLLCAWDCNPRCLSMYQRIQNLVKKCSELGFGRCFCLLDSCWILGRDSWSFFLFQCHSHLHSGVLSSLAGSHLQPAGTRRRVWDEVVLPRPAGGRASSGMSVSQIVPEQILLENLLKLDD